MYKCEVCGRECDDNVKPYVLHPSSVKKMKDNLELGHRFCPIISSLPISELPDRRICN
jgi:hypothetical protein